MPKEISEEDKALFREAVNQIKPGRKKTVAKTASEPKKSSISLNLSSYYSEEVEANTALTYVKSGISLKRFNRFCSDRDPLEGWLDLHGADAETAALLLTDFLEREQYLLHRKVLVIHGKGGGTKPLLKNLVNCWLKQIPSVLAFHSALPKDGGTGAVYVLLQRHKPKPLFIADK
jgi:DNA-nicking Smr family endonuclease